MRSSGADTPGPFLHYSTFILCRDRVFLLHIPRRHGSGIVGAGRTGTLCLGAFPSRYDEPYQRSFVGNPDGHRYPECTVNGPPGDGQYYDAYHEHRHLQRRLQEPQAYDQGRRSCRRVGGAKEQQYRPGECQRERCCSRARERHTFCEDARVVEQAEDG
jgi:hypothetical protein